MTSFKFSQENACYNDNIFYLENKVVKKSVSMYKYTEFGINSYAGFLLIENLKESSQIIIQFLFINDKYPFNHDNLKFRKNDYIFYPKDNPSFFFIKHSLMDDDFINYEKYCENTKDFVELFNYIEKYNKNLIFV